ncbi:hypothetical protein F4824DRAFT_195068 [Ustulina deusta]|nr:hypothetical protein F4824DRAFT_195068 [Ustulina deusta]
MRMRMRVPVWVCLGLGLGLVSRSVSMPVSTSCFLAGAVRVPLSLAPVAVLLLRASWPVASSAAPLRWLSSVSLLWLSPRLRPQIYLRISPWLRLLLLLLLLVVSLARLFAPHRVAKPMTVPSSHTSVFEMHFASANRSSEWLSQEDQHGVRNLGTYLGSLDPAGSA